MEDKVLVKKVKGGDKAAFCELVKQKKEMLYKLAYMYVKNEHKNKLETNRHILIYIHNLGILRIIVSCVLSFFIFIVYISRIFW